MSPTVGPSRLRTPGHERHVDVQISVVALVVTIMQVVKIRRPVTAWGMQLGSAD